MKRLIIQAIINICVKSLLITTITGIAIGIIGYLNQWNSSNTYSNAFFVAGCLIIIAAASSRIGAGEDWKIFQLLYTERFREMSSGERANFIIIQVNHDCLTT